MTKGAPRAGLAEAKQSKSLHTERTRGAHWASLVSELFESPVTDREVGFVIYWVLDQQIETDEGLRIDFGTPPPGVRVSSFRQYETVEFVDNFCGALPGRGS